MKPIALRHIPGVLALLLSSSFVFLAALEMSLRLFAPQIQEIHPHGLWRQSPTRGFGLVPSFVGQHVFDDFQVKIAISAHGLRDRLYGPKSPNTFRILTLGDSFTFGFGVEALDAYPKRLESILRVRTAVPAFEVINGGASGYATNQELVFLHEEGLSFQPDLVLIGFFGFNDFRDNQLPMDRFTVSDGYLYDRDGYEEVLKAKQRGLDLPGKGYLWAKSHAYRFLAQRYHQLLDNRGASPESLPVAPAVSQRPKDATTGRQGPDDEQFDATTALITAIADTARSHTARVALVLIPDFKDAQNTQSVWEPTWKRMEAFCETRQIPVINLSGVFRAAHQAGRTPELWYQGNQHWRVAGHQLAAETIFRELVDLGLIPGGANR